MIGIFDSGLGGLTIYKQIRQLLPQEDILYYADTANVPYGEKTEEQIRDFTLTSLNYLKDQGCNIIIIACNTATTSGIDYYRDNIDLPLIGVVPVIKTAAQLSQNKKIALLATSKTVDSKYTDELINKFAADCKVKKIACPGWVEAIETNTINDDILKKYLNQITNQDIAVLGCTHYTIIKGQIQKILGPDIKVINSTEAVARHTLRVMQEQNLLNPQSNPKNIFQCTGNNEKFQAQIKDLPVRFA